MVLCLITALPVVSFSQKVKIKNDVAYVDKVPYFALQIAVIMGAL